MNIDSVRDYGLSLPARPQTFIKSVISDPYEAILSKLNRKAQEELGVTKKQGSRKETQRALARNASGQK